MDINSLHDVICDLLIQSGGVPGNEVVPEGKNADVIFRDHKVIVEVKTQTIDRATTKEHHDRAVKIIARYRSSIGLDPENFDVLSDDLPPHIANEIARDFARPFKEHITKANRQIKNTRKYTGNSYKGLLILGMKSDYLANEGSVFSFLTQHAMQFSGVDCVLMLTISSKGGPTPPMRVVLSERRSGVIPRDLLNTFDTHWIAKLENEYGHDFHRHRAPAGAFERDFGLVQQR